jgi:hypothetical protein
MITGFIGLGLAGLGTASAAWNVGAHGLNWVNALDLGSGLSGVYASARGMLKMQAGYAALKAKHAADPGGSARKRRAWFAPGEHPRIPTAGEIVYNRQTGKPPTHALSIYEFFDLKANKWYVGSGILLRRLSKHISDGRLAGYDEAVWQVVRYDGGRATPLHELAEQIRIEQLGGVAGLANKKQVVPLDNVRKFLDKKPVDWPKWLYLPD